jgi:hypothetical protein
MCFEDVSDNRTPRAACGAFTPKDWVSPVSHDRFALISFSRRAPQERMNFTEISSLAPAGTQAGHGLVAVKGRLNSIYPRRCSGSVVVAVIVNVASTESLSDLSGYPRNPVLG